MSVNLLKFNVGLENRMWILHVDKYMLIRSNLYIYIFIMNGTWWVLSICLINHLNYNFFRTRNLIRNLIVSFFNEFLIFIGNKIDSVALVLTHLNSNRNDEYKIDFRRKNKRNPNIDWFVTLPYERYEVFLPLSFHRSIEELPNFAHLSLIFCSLDIVKLAIGMQWCV